MTTTITAAAAATQAGVTTATIRLWARRGVIAATKTAGRWAINAASLAHRIAIAAMRRTRKAATVTEPAKPALPWGNDHPGVAFLNAAVKAGVPVDRIVAIVGRGALGSGQPLRRREENTLRRETEEAIARMPKSQRPASPRQVQYILDLLATRRRNGDGGGFYRGPADRAGIEALSMEDASLYITSLREDY